MKVVVGDHYQQITKNKWEKNAQKTQDSRFKTKQIVYGDILDVFNLPSLYLLTY